MHVRGNVPNSKPHGLCRPDSRLPYVSSDASSDELVATPLPIRPPESPWQPSGSPATTTSTARWRSYPYPATATAYMGCWAASWDAIRWCSEPQSLAHSCDFVSVCVLSQSVMYCHVLYMNCVGAVCVGVGVCRSVCIPEPLLYPACLLAT